MKRLLPATLILCLSTAPVSAAPDGWVLDDFNDGDLIAASEHSWGAISDALIGGSSKVSLSTFEDRGRGRVLRLSGSIAPEGFMGAWVAVEREGRAVDLSAFDGIRLRLRGEGEWLVGIRGAADNTFVNYQAPVKVGADWQEYQVRFADLTPNGKPSTEGSPGFDARQARWLGVGAPGGRSGELSVEIDDVELYSTRAGTAPRPGEASGASLDVRVPRARSEEVKDAKWQRLTSDASGDVERSSLPDALSLSSWHDGKHGLIWFRLETAAEVPSAFGANIVLDLDGDPNNGMAWWGKNTGLKFDRVVTAWAYVSDAQAVQGLIGIADAKAAAAGTLIDSAQPRPRVTVEQGGRAILIGVPQAALGGAKGPIRVLGAVGSPWTHNDDVPGEGAAVLSLR